MEPTEQIAFVIVLGLAFALIIYGLLKLRGTGLLQRRKSEDWNENYLRISNTERDPMENSEEFAIDLAPDFTTDFPKNQEDDLE